MEQHEVFPFWEAYQQSDCRRARNELIRHYYPLVRLVAFRVKAKYAPYSTLSDLISEGTFGLIDAISKFDRERGVKFESYATIRIRGAMIDSLRRWYRTPPTTYLEDEVYPDDEKDAYADELADTTVSGFDVVDTRQTIRNVRHLGLRDRTILELVYCADVPMTTIGQIFGVCESRVSQLHTRSLRKLRLARDVA